MHITIRQLQIVDAIVQLGSYSLAAERLHMTQPAVSMQMKQLENSTGITLFERQGKQVALTEAGENIYQKCFQVTTAHENLVETINEVKDFHRGRIKVSATTTSNHLITQMIACFSKEHRDIKVSLKITNREKLLCQLKNFEPDIVLMGEPPPKLNLSHDRLILNPLFVIAHTGHPYAKKTHIPFKEIAQHEFILREQGPGTRAAIELFFADRKEKIKSTLEMGSNEAIKHAVSAGLGLGLVSLHSIKLELEAKKLVILDVNQLPIKRHWHIVKIKDKQLLPAAKQFQDYMIEESKKYAKSYEPFLKK